MMHHTIIPTKLDKQFPCCRFPPDSLSLATSLHIIPCELCTLCIVKLILCNVQMSKVTSALLSGKYSSPPPSVDMPPQVDGDADGDAIAKAADKGNKDDDMVWVAPRMLKHLVGQGHAEFSSGRQQDAAEYMQHLLEASSVCPMMFLPSSRNVYNCTHTFTGHVI